MKKTTRIFTLLSAVLLLLVGCAQGNKIGQKTKEAETSTSNSVKDSSSSTEASSSESASDTALTDADVQQIGTDEFGYVYVPSDWVQFQDVAGGDTYQYSDLDAYTIVTLFSYDKETLGVETIDDAAAEQAANAYAYGIEQSGEFGEITGAKAQIAGYEAYQIYSKATADDKLLCAWIFVTEAKDKVYLVSLEGQQDSEAFLTAFAYVEESWSATK